MNSGGAHSWLVALALAAASPAWSALAADAEMPDYTDLLIERGAEVDAEMAVILLDRAVRQDAADTVVGLLAIVDLENLDFAPLHEAAAHGSFRTAKALLDAGFDANQETALWHVWPPMPNERRLHGAGTGPTKPLKPLHMAARHESAAVAALLIERGADVNAVDGHGDWTPLHYALLDGLHRPGLRTANLLVEHGADVNAATLVMGWTPLHLAASLSACQTRWRECGLSLGSAWTPEVLELVQTLIEHGANADARTRVGGWTPAHVAMESAPRDYDESREPLQAVLAALRAAGGTDDHCGWAKLVPFYYAGESRSPQEGMSRKPGCFNMRPFIMPDLAAGSHTRVPASFTAPDAMEWLVFEAAGASDDGYFYRLASVQDQQGNVSPVLGFNRFTQYKGLCRDPDTGTHTAIFAHGCDVRNCRSTTTYFRYDADAGTLVEVFAGSTQPTGKNVACRWREEAAERDERRRAARTYRDVVSALRVGKSPLSGPSDDDAERMYSNPLWEGVLPTRKVSADVVESQLERLRGLPDVGRVWDVDWDSSEGKILVVEYNSRRPAGWRDAHWIESADACEGVLLAWNGARQEWRSIYDCADLSDIEIDGDRLSAALYVSECGNPWKYRPCYLEVDLTTWQAELWNEF